MGAYKAALLAVLLGLTPSAGGWTAVPGGRAFAPFPAAPAQASAGSGARALAAALPAAPPQDTGRAADRPAEVKDLPLIVAPAAGGVMRSVPNAPNGNVLVILVTGDGGWASIDRGVAGVLTDSGVPVVGFNMLKYLWTRRTPDQAGADLERLVRAYAGATGRHEVALVGYSRGADVLPFMVARLAPDVRREIRLVALLGPSRTVDFKFHVADWWTTTNHQSDLPVLPEATRLLGGVRVLCAYGADDGDTICPSLPADSAEIVRLAGSHHFDGAYAELGRRVLQALAPRAASGT